MTTTLPLITRSLIYPGYLFISKINVPKPNFQFVRVWKPFNFEFTLFCVIVDEAKLNPGHVVVERTCVVVDRENI